MVTVKPTHGYLRRRDVPGTNVKVCKTCRKWFSARPREQICDGCVPVKIRVKRLALSNHPNPAPRVSRNRRSQGIYSEPLGVTFKPGVPLWRVLAFEAVSARARSQTRRKGQ